MSKGATRLTASRFPSTGAGAAVRRRCAHRARGVTARGCERAGDGGGPESGRRADRHSERGLCNARLGAGRRRDRLPDRAHAGRRRQRAHGRVRDRRRLAAASHRHARLAAVRRGRLRARRPLPVARPRPLRDDEPQPFSEPVFGTTRPQWGTGPGAGLRTGWESSGNATYTTHAQEIEYTERARRRQRPRPLRRARPHEPDPVGRPARPATARSTCSSSATRRRRRPRRRSRTGRRSSTTATSTATSRRAASRA